MNYIEVANGIIQSINRVVGNDFSEELINDIERFNVEIAEEELIEEEEKEVCAELVKLLVQRKQYGCVYDVANAVFPGLDNRIEYLIDTCGLSREKLVMLVLIIVCDMRDPGILSLRGGNTVEKENMTELPSVENIAAQLEGLCSVVIDNTNNIAMLHKLHSACSRKFELFQSNLQIVYSTLQQKLREIHKELPPLRALGSSGINSIVIGTWLLLFL